MASLPPMSLLLPSPSTSYGALKPWNLGREAIHGPARSVQEAHGKPIAPESWSYCPQAAGKAWAPAEPQAHTGG